MKSLNRKLDQERKVLDEIDVEFLDGADQLDDLKRVSEDIYYVLVEKTEGDAGLRVNSGETGEGLNAYMRLYLWFAGITGLALTEKTRELMHPNPVKHEHEIADALEKMVRTRAHAEGARRRVQAQRRVQGNRAAGAHELQARTVRDA